MKKLFGSLNPCFNGRCTRTIIKHAERRGNESLNPCFNGRCTRTDKQQVINSLLQVLILVLMEDALAQLTKMNKVSFILTVLILVLMEDALARVGNSINNVSN